MRRPLALALLGSVGLLAALRWRDHRLHLVDRGSKLAEGSQRPAQMSHDFATDPRLLPGGGRVVDHHFQCDPPDTGADAEARRALEVDYRRFQSAFGMIGQAQSLDARFAHNSSSIGTGHTADVARQPAAVRGRPLSVAIPRAA